MKLFDFQERGLKETERFNRCAYYWEMGTGKTFTGTEKMWRLNTHVNLIVCQKSKIDDWFEHVLDNYGSKGAIVYDLTIPKHLELFLSEAKKEGKGYRLIGIINYDLLFRKKDLSSLKNLTLVLDESSMIQNEKAKRTKFILKMDAQNLILLSGTPVGGKYEHLWSQCQLLGWDIPKNEFWDKYINYRLYSPAPNVYPIKIVTGYKNVDDLKANLAKHGANFLKTDEVIDLPEQVFSTIQVPTSSEYRRFLKDSIVEVEGETLVSDNKLKGLLYARQLCSTYSKEKLNAFRDWVESTNSRLIVFYNFTSELERLLTAVSDKPISIVNGAKRDLEAYEKYENSITFIQYQAGALGLNLQKANHIGYYSLPLSSELFEQSKKRTHRLGQTKTCFYYTFICEGSVENAILDTLKKRRDYTEALFVKGN